MTSKLANHYGYGLRNDEKPYAHKIPPGGNWRNLTAQEQTVYWNGKVPTEGGSTNGLRRRSWDEPAGTITTTPFQKLSCQLHPGPISEEDGQMTENHIRKDISDKALEGYARRNAGGGFGFRVNPWDEPSPTIFGRIFNEGKAFVHPGPLEGEINEMEFNVTPQLPSNGLTVAELFAGGGLMAVGLKSAGYDLVWANDFEKAPCVAYAHNIGPHIVQADITTINPADIPETDIIAGGPPCQDYSVAGKGEGEEGDRGKLVWTYLDIIKAKQPKAFIFENVKGLIQTKHRATFDALLAKFAEIGYTVSWKLVNAWDYGVAQKRERVFIVGVRNDLGFTYQFPEPLPGDYRAQTLRHAIGDLPEPGEKPGDHRNQDKLPVSAYKEYPNFDSANDGAPWEGPSVTIRAGTITGQPWHPDKYGPKNHDDKSYWTPKSEYTYDQANRVMDMEKPCNTVPAHHNSGQPIHPTQAPRRFTVRECLRIQSVPDWYVLPDSMKLGPQYRIVGNGVASRVAYLLGIALAEQLKAAEGL